MLPAVLDFVGEGGIKLWRNEEMQLVQASLGHESSQGPSARCSVALWFMRAG